jgi:hypothetical protein
LKRGLHDSEYERVRRKAGMDRPEFPEDEPDRDGRLAADRVAEKARETMAILIDRQNQDENERRAKAAADMDGVRRRTNERLMRESWKRYGLEQPSPQASLELYISIGWRLEHTAEGWKLFQPVGFVPRATRTNEIGS